MQTFNLKLELNPSLQLEKKNKKEEERESERSFPQANLIIAAALLDIVNNLILIKKVKKWHRCKNKKTK